jgi:hypothetical protein
VRNLAPEVLLSAIGRTVVHDDLIDAVLDDQSDDPT